MSIHDLVTIKAESAEETAKIGFSLPQSFYRKNQTILVSGELGAGKTTLIQGIAQGLGIEEPVTSPTYALEQRYGEGILSHIDLYRLSEKQAEEFVGTLDEFTGVRIIEWPERAKIPDATMTIEITEIPEGRSFRITAKDVPVPSEREIREWVEEVMLPEHIVAHMKAVTDVAGKIVKELLKQKRFVRPEAVWAAALTHDLLRFVDFKTLTGDEYFSPTKEQSEHWKRLKEKYGTPHEAAAEKFLTERGFAEIGTIVSAHRGLSPDGGILTSTIEQKCIAYADKRVAFDRPVTLDERFDDFMKRYSNGKETPHARAWRVEMKRLESELFPDDVPF